MIINDSIRELVDIVPLLALLLSSVLGILFALIFLRSQAISRVNQRAIIDNINNEGANADLGGYVVVDIPNEKKGLFQDLLKGFEEYAEVKGYKVTISTDTSLDGKIAFKFTIVEYGVTTSPNQVKKDLNEYIRKIQKGDDFDDLHKISESVETQRIIMALKNRISFLQQNYQVEKNINEFYEKFFDKINLSSISHLPMSIQLNQSNQGAIEMDTKSYSANNSANVMQGDNHSNMLETGDIKIGVTHKDRVNQLDKLDKLLEVLNSNDENIAKAKRKVELVKDELQDEEKPDKKSIFKWLSKVKEILDTAKTAEKIYSHAKDVYEAFGIQP